LHDFVGIRAAHATCSPAIKRAAGPKTHFVLLASNGRVVVTSETYESKAACEDGRVERWRGGSVSDEVVPARAMVVAFFQRTGPGTAAAS